MSNSGTSSAGGGETASGFLASGVTLAGISEEVGSIPGSKRLGRTWLVGFGIAFLLLMVLLGTVTWLFAKGVGIWGIQIPVAWGFAIINFVWWIGIGHAGTFISAILLLLQKQWRRSINRFAESMTLFAVACAGMFPLLHLGRPQFFYYILPYPNDMALWPQFRSPLVWDFFAVGTYAAVSVVFWYLGLVPDLATMRERHRQKNHLTRARIYGIFALGWVGSAIQWKHYKVLYLVLAGLATPLVISVHSVVGLDFAISIVSTWHKTVYPPYFVAGAIFSGFAMVATLVIPVRRWFGLHDLITNRHLDSIGKVMLATGMLVTFGYFSENFFDWYSGGDLERRSLAHHWTGKIAPLYYLLIACNVVAIQFLWAPSVRRSPVALFILSLIVNVGMWLERYIIVAGALGHSDLPAMSRAFETTFWDWSVLAGSLGLFLCLVYLLIRYVPLIAMHEVKESISESGRSAATSYKVLR